MVKSAPKLVLVIWIATAGLLIAGNWAYHAGYRLNSTVSMPAGLYQTHPRSSEPLHRGALVLLCPPDTQSFQLAVARHYIGAGDCPGQTQALLKPVAAIAGDTVRVTGQGLQVNGHWLPHSQVLSQDSAGRPIPGIAMGTYPVPAGQIWLISSHSPNSYDSRYFGPVPEHAVQAIALPVLTGE